MCLDAGEADVLLCWRWCFHQTDHRGATDGPKRTKRETRGTVEETLPQTRTSKRHTGTGPRAAHTPSEKEDGWRRRERASQSTQRSGPHAITPDREKLIPASIQASPHFQEQNQQICSNGQASERRAYQQRDRQRSLRRREEESRETEAEPTAKQNRRLPKVDLGLWLHGRKEREKREERNEKRLILNSVCVCLILWSWRDELSFNNFFLFLCHIH